MQDNNNQHPHATSCGSPEQFEVESLRRCGDFALPVNESKEQKDTQTRQHSTLIELCICQVNSSFHPLNFKHQQTTARMGGFSTNYLQHKFQRFDTVQARLKLCRRESHEKPHMRQNPSMGDLQLGSFSLGLTSGQQQQVSRLCIASSHNP
eukprot:3405108-Amphidinium_carterae.1